MVLFNYVNKKKKVKYLTFFFIGFLLIFSCNQNKTSLFIEKFQEDWTSYIGALTDSTKYRTGLAELSTVTDTMILYNEILRYKNSLNTEIPLEYLFSSLSISHNDKLDELFLGIQGGGLFDQMTLGKAFPGNLYCDILKLTTMEKNLSIFNENAYVSFLSENSEIYLVRKHKISPDFETFLVHTRYNNFSNMSSTFLINAINDCICSVVQVGLNIDIEGYKIETQTRTDGHFFITTTEYFQVKNDFINTSKAVAKNKILYTQFFFDKDGNVQFVNPSSLENTK